VTRDQAEGVTFAIFSFGFFCGLVVGLIAVGVGLR